MNSFFKSGRNKYISFKWKNTFSIILEIRMSFDSSVIYNILFQFFNVNSVLIENDSVMFLDPSHNSSSLFEKFSSIITHSTETLYYKCFSFNTFYNMMFFSLVFVMRILKNVSNTIKNS